MIVKNIKIDQAIKFHKTIVVCVKHDKKNSKIIVRKKKGACNFSIPYYSGNFDDLLNRVELA